MNHTDLVDIKKFDSYLDSYEANRKIDFFTVLERKVFHWLDQDKYALNPELDKTIYELTTQPGFWDQSRIKERSQIKEKEINSLRQLERLAETEGASDESKEKLKNFIYQLATEQANLVNTQQVANKTTTDGYFVINNPYDPVSFVLGTYSPYPVTFEDRTYKCAEAAFQASKFPDHVRAGFQKIENGNEAREYAKSLKNTKQIEGWGEGDNPSNTMRTILNLRLQQNPALQQLLLATGDSYLVAHSDNPYWGDAKGEGQNMLGKIIMEQRGELGNEVPGIVVPSSGYLDAYPPVHERETIRLCTYNLGESVANYRNLIPEDERFAETVEGARKELKTQMMNKIINNKTADVFCLQGVGEENGDVLSKLQNEKFKLLAISSKLETALAINTNRFENIEEHKIIDGTTIATAIDKVTNKKVMFLSDHLAEVALEDLREDTTQSFEDYQADFAKAGDKALRDILTQIKDIEASCDLVIIGADFNASPDKYKPRFDPLEDAGYEIYFSDKPTNRTTNKKLARKYTDRKLDGFAIKSKVDDLRVIHLPSPIKLDADHSPSDHAPQIIEVSYSIQTLWDKFLKLFS